MNTIISVILFVLLALVVGFVIGCVYSDAHWQPIVRKYKRIIEDYGEFVD